MFKTFGFGPFGIRICFEFRYSYFGFYTTTHIMPLVDAHLQIRTQSLRFTVFAIHAVPI
jgi:hypothetical protein